MEKKQNPMISIFMPCYNHENYVRQAIESVLNQTWQDFEFIIVENGSTDNSRSVIKEYENRAEIIYIDKNNLGRAHREAFSRSKGKYYAYMCSDDVWMPDKLEKQITFLHNHPEYQACFAWAEYGDKNLETIDVGITYQQENRTPEEWIEFFWNNGNRICAPSMLMERDFVTKSGMHQDVAYWQMPDLCFWLNFLMAGGKFYIYPEVLVKMRKHESATTFSGNTKIRAINEMPSIQECVFDTISDEMFIKVFGKNFICADARTHDELLCEKILIMFAKADLGFAIQPTAINYFYRNYKKVDVLMQDKYGLDKHYFAEKCGEMGTAIIAQEYYKRGESDVRTAYGAAADVLGNIADGYKQITAMLEEDRQTILMPELKAILIEMNRMIEQVDGKIKVFEHLVPPSEWEQYKEILGQKVCLVREILPLAERITDYVECMSKVYDVEAKRTSGVAVL